MGGTGRGLLPASMGVLEARVLPSEDGCLGREGEKRWGGWGRGNEGEVP